MNVSDHKITVGIRPDINGRRGGVRESLESQTLALAQAAAKLLLFFSRYGVGSPLPKAATGRIGFLNNAASISDRKAWTITLSDKTSAEIQP